MHDVLAVTTLEKLQTSWPWYATRASGIVALVLIVLLMITGISSFTGHQFRFMSPIKAWANHRTLGIALSVAVSVHVISILFDTYIRFTIPEVLLPFASHYKQTSLLGIPVGSLGVAMGVAGLYLLIAIVLTSLTKIRTAKPPFWKNVHYLSYALVLLAFFHSLMIGTDFKLWWLRLLWIAAHLTVLGFVALRLSRSGSLE